MPAGVAAAADDCSAVSVPTRSCFECCRCCCRCCGRTSYDTNAGAIINSNSADNYSRLLNKVIPPGGEVICLHLAILAVPGSIPSPTHRTATPHRGNSSNADVLISSTLIIFLSRISFIYLLVHTIMPRITATYTYIMPAMHNGGQGIKVYPLHRLYRIPSYGNNKALEMSNNNVMGAAVILGGNNVANDNRLLCIICIQNDDGCCAAHGAIATISSSRNYRPHRAAGKQDIFWM